MKRPLQTLLLLALLCLSVPCGADDLAGKILRAPGTPEDDLLDADETSEVYTWPGGSGTFQVTGTFTGSPSVQFQFNADTSQPTAGWQSVEGCAAITTAGGFCNFAMGETFIRVVVTGGTGADIVRAQVTPAHQGGSGAATDFLPLDGSDPMTGELTADALGIEFEAGDALTDCSTFSATGGGVFFDDSEGILKKCQDNVLTDLDTSAGASAAGADTQIQFNNSGALGADSLFVWDAAADELGVGTATPATGLDLGGVSPTFSTTLGPNVAAIGGGTEGQLWIQGSSQAVLTLDDSGAPFNEKVFQVVNNGGLTFARVIEDDGAGQVASNMIVFEHNTGDVGIGAQPGVNFHVSRSVSTTGGTQARVTNTSTATNSVSLITVQGNNTAVTGKIEADGLGTVWPAAAVAVGSFSAHPVYLIHGNAIQVTLTAGNLQVGTGADASDSYVQVDWEAGAPPAGDCDADAKGGRTIVDSTNHRFYICNGVARAWDWVALTD